MADEPRAWTEDEVRDMIVQVARDTARYWTTVHPVSGPPPTVEDRCHGVAFSILAALDGCGMTLPAVKLVMDPHPDDKEFLRALGTNWFEPGTAVAAMLHEFYHKRD